ncbi:PAS domain S-box protein [Marinobacterium rhizophilum]|uniref:histidine kinase n=1 Tax=Marinobacterium rhizophilum TaxID=420402 RepID=A0ABY5HJK7_9GAMM|nr:PAS domain S-box protein [Marinobacterium rhizophilum]UTW12041.1 PAS domain S-box protein [Marinobacterium rhizophilum]
MSFRLKIIIGIVLIQACVFALLVGLAMYYLNAWSQQDLRSRARDTSQIFATMATDAVISTDLATLTDMVNQIKVLPQIAYITVSDARGLLASYTGDAGIATGQDTAVAPALNDDVLDIRTDIRAGALQFGEIRLGYHRLGILQRLQEAGLWLAFIALAGLILLALVSWWLGWRLTQMLGWLQRYSEDVANGVQTASMKVTGQDELAMTARAFNSMLASLESKQRKLAGKIVEVQSLSDLNAQNERYLRTVLESVSDGIITIDANGLIHLINRAGERLFGYAKNELVGQHVGVLISGLEQGWHEQYIDGDLNTGASPICSTGQQMMGHRPDSTFFPVDLSASALDIEGQRFCVVLIRDLTASRELEAEIRRSHKIKAMITDASLDALITVDVDGVVVEYNGAAERLFGWPRSSMLGQSMAEHIIPEEFRDAHYKGMAHFRKNGAGPLIGGRVEVEALCEKGTRIPVEMSLVATESDGVRLVTAFLRDIRARQQAERQLIDAKEAAENASLAKSRFLSHMSHEIRSPLNAVLAAVSMLLERANDADQQRLLQTAQSSGAALLSVINEVLDFSKIDAGYMKITNSESRVETLIGDVLCAAQGHMGSQAPDLVCHVMPAASGKVFIDPARVRQVINVLVDNAIKFTSQGVIAVIAERIEVNGLEHLKISVKDTGVGIPEEQQSAIFEEFEQVDATRDTGYGGTGLGLTIARRLVEMMGGTLIVDSKPGVGSCFHFSLPAEFCDAEQVCMQASEGLALCMLSTNDALRTMFEHNLASLNIPFRGGAGFGALSRWVQDIPPAMMADCCLVIDESVLDELKAPESVSILQRWCGRVGVMCRVQETLPGILDAAVRLTKPISCTELFNFICGEAKAEDDSSQSDLLSSEDTSPGRVLLVEDVAANRWIAKILLESRGYEVTEAADGLEALDQAARESFDVILMDVRMPRLNGLDAVIRLRDESGPNANTPVIALTANAERSEIDRCLAAGMNEFISKPYDTSRLLERVAYFCEQRYNSEESPVLENTVATAPLLQVSVLEQLVKDTSVSVLPGMLQMFCEEIEGCIREIQEGVTSLDQKALTESAHTLKSCAGTFGAFRLQNAARELERCGRASPDPEKLEALAKDLLVILADTLHEYQGFSMQQMGCQA